MHRNSFCLEIKFLAMGLLYVPILPMVLLRALVVAVKYYENMTMENYVNILTGLRYRRNCQNILKLSILRLIYQFL